MWKFKEKIGAQELNTDELMALREDRLRQRGRDHLVSEEQEGSEW